MFSGILEVGPQLVAVRLGWLTKLHRKTSYFAQFDPESTCHLLSHNLASYGNCKLSVPLALIGVSGKLEPIPSDCVFVERRSPPWLVAHLATHSVNKFWTSACVTTQYFFFLCEFMDQMVKIDSHHLKSSYSVPIVCSVIKILTLPVSKCISTTTRCRVFSIPNIS